MAIQEHVAVLKQGVAVWNEWLRAKREGDPDFQPDLSGANLSGANLGMAQLNGTNLGGADLTNAHLFAANLSGANLTAANLSGTRLNGAILSGAQIPYVRWDRARMRGNYLGIRGLDSCFGNALFKRAAADQDFLDTLMAHWQPSWRIWLFRAWGWIDYGRSLPRVLSIAFFIAFIYGLIYSFWPSMLNCTTWSSDYFTPFYFSIVTYTTLGFGDINPKGHWIGEVIVSSEVIVGYATLGLLLAVLAEKIARRS